MATAKVGISSNELVIPLDTPLGRELFDKADYGDSIDVTLGSWKHYEEYGSDDSRLRTGELDVTATVHIAHIAPEAVFPNVSTSKLPQRIVSNFPTELLRDAVDHEDSTENENEVYIDLDNNGYERIEQWIEIDVERLTKTDFSPDGVDEEVYVFDDVGTLVPASEPDASDRRFCPGCGEAVDDGVSFCAYCGEEL